VSGKTSRYNPGVYVNECQLCGKKDQKLHVSPLETHHINEQKDFKDGYHKDKLHVLKNSKANLMVLCAECHDRIHHEGIEVEGYVMTSQGRTAVLKDKDNNKILVNSKTSKTSKTGKTKVLDKIAATASG
jgi:hypothetical protein